MAFRAFILGIESHLDAEIGPFPYADQAVRKWHAALIESGIPDSHIQTLTAPQATFAVLGSRLTRFAAAVPKVDTLVILIAARGFTYDEQSFLATWDTLADDADATAFAIPDLIAMLKDSPAKCVVVLWERLPWVDEDESEVDDFLEAGLSDSDKVAMLVTASPGETAHTAATLKTPLAAFLIAEAIAGRAGKALNPAGAITTRSLFVHLTDELPRLLRKHIDTEAVQTPRLLGNPALFDEPWLDLSAKLGGDAGKLLQDPEQLARVCFRSEKHVRVKDLTEWRKSFQIPESATASNRKFVARIASVDVKAEAEALIAAARTLFEYKRKDVDVEYDSDGTAVVRTPEFTYSVAAVLDADDPTKVTIASELSRLASLDFIRSEHFRELFQDKFDRMAFAFAKPIDVEALIDRFEEKPPTGVKLHVTDGTTLEMTIVGKPGRLTIERHAVSVQGRGGLLELFLGFLAKVGPLDADTGLKPMLPAKR